MTSINPRPELYNTASFQEQPTPVIKPREGETLRSWLTRKKHALMFHSWYPKLHFNDRDFGVIDPREGG